MNQDATEFAGVTAESGIQNDPTLAQERRRVDFRFAAKALEANLDAAAQ